MCQVLILSCPLSLAFCRTYHASLNPRSVHVLNDILNKRSCENSSNGSDKCSHLMHMSNMVADEQYISKHPTGRFAPRLRLKDVYRIRLEQKGKYTPSKHENDRYDRSIWIPAPKKERAPASILAPSKASTPS
jgi:hypothetical protein